MVRFNDTRFMPAAEKRRVLRHWEAFLQTLVQRFSKKDRCFAKFSDPLYKHLTLHCSFIAHYNRLGFFEHYFNTGDDTRRFLRQFDRKSNPVGLTVEYGSSSWLRGEYADINEAMRDTATPVAPAIAQAAQADQRRRDLTLARRLAAKHAIPFPGV